MKIEEEKKWVQMEDYFRFFLHAFFLPPVARLLCMESREIPAIEVISHKSFQSEHHGNEDNSSIELVGLLKSIR